MLEVQNLVKNFPIYSGGLLRRHVGDVHAVADVSFSLFPGDTLGLVGESGCGKSTTGRVVLGLEPATSGSVTFEGRDLVRLSGRQLRPLRREMQIVFQDPYASLDPRMPVSSILAEPFQIHGLWDRKAGPGKVRDLMATVGLNPEHGNRYPHEFSGGQRQRIGIARALALEPRVLVLDEPVSALDVSIQAGVVNLLEDLQERLGLTYLFIAHDLSVVRHIADRVAVMYLGKIVEMGARDDVFDAPVHPYTLARIRAVPSPDPRRERSRERIILTGDVPSPASPPSGCHFRTRCFVFRDLLDDARRAACLEEYPALLPQGPGHFASCHYPEVRAVA
jgi:peptide/nickel transport system ATP-binding protein/oligopeptide transport system ATP-binding protein